MADSALSKPDPHCLFQTAASQHGYFTVTQARECGFGTDLLTYHTRSGRFHRVYRGVYRVRDYPSSDHEEVVAAWLAVGRHRAVLSHESALDLFELSDVVPNAVHLTLPRGRRYLSPPQGVQLHTVSAPLDRAEVVERDGIRVTSPARTIIDAAESGVGPEQIEKALREALQRGLVSQEQLIAAARGRPRRVRDLIDGALEQART
jgi:predicted transcriptional regulator of viral defense system